MCHHSLCEYSQRSVPCEMRSHVCGTCTCVTVFAPLFPGRAGTHDKCKRASACVCFVAARFVGVWPRLGMGEGRAFVRKAGRTQSMEITKRPALLSATCMCSLPLRRTLQPPNEPPRVRGPCQRCNSAPLHCFRPALECALLLSRNTF
jgi:hypothetical protein